MSDKNLICLKHSEEWAIEQSRLNPGKRFECRYYYENGAVGYRWYRNGKCNQEAISCAPRKTHWTALPVK